MCAFVFAATSATLARGPWGRATALHDGGVRFPSLRGAACLRWRRRRLLRRWRCRARCWRRRLGRWLGRRRRQGPSTPFPRPASSLQTVRDLFSTKEAARVYHRLPRCESYGAPAPILSGTSGYHPTRFRPATDNYAQHSVSSAGGSARSPRGMYPPPCSRLAWERKQLPS